MSDKYISCSQLCEAIKNATITREIAVRDTDFYAKYGDTALELISYIDPHLLLDEIEGMLK